MIDKRLLEVLACPRCEDRPALQSEGSVLVCPQCGAVYEIVDGIPDLMPESGDVRKDNDE